jgi:hypothetical protein
MMREVEGLRIIIPIKIVQCRCTWCGAYSFCGHAKEHKKRVNCYNDEPGDRRQCPACQPMEIRNYGL